ncbi:MAG: guanylate kinase [Deltaproteobacteria bacterium]|nr:guanylate kinase [Deltaproteobacteria bacterium]
MPDEETGGRMADGRLIIISAPSGGGKTSVIRYLMERHPDMVHSISATTRPARPGGADAGYYEMVDEPAFRDGVRDGAFAEWAEVHGFLYGTPRGPLDRWLDEGRDVIADVDVVGGESLKRAYGDRAISIFLLPPSMEALGTRLARRGTDSEEVRGVRLRNAAREVACQDRYDHRVVNDDLDRACAEIERILYGGGCGHGHGYGVREGGKP